MQISPVSFGKIYKVDAPLNIACKLADIANNKEETPVSKDLKKIFNDEYVEAYADNLNPYGSCWLISGKDRDYNSTQYAKHTAWGCNHEDFKNYRRTMEKYFILNANGMITVAHNGKTPKAVDVVL